jgi:hypothetical protein
MQVDGSRDRNYSTGSMAAATSDVVGAGINLEKRSNVIKVICRLTRFCRLGDEEADRVKTKAEGTPRLCHPASSLSANNQVQPFHDLALHAEEKRVTAYDVEL